MLHNDEETKEAASISHTWRKNQRSKDRLLPDSKGSEGEQKAGSVQRQKSEDGAAAGVEASEREKRTGHKFRRQPHTHRAREQSTRMVKGAQQG